MRMKMKKLGTIFLLIVLIMSVAWGQITLLLEDFEDGTVNYTTSISEFSDKDVSTGYDYFIRTDGSDINGESFANIQGSYYFAAQDIDGEDATLPVYLLFDDIDINGYNTLTFTVFIAEDDASSDEDWDEPDYVHLVYDIDNSGSFSNLLWIENDGSSTNSAPLIDTNFDGTGDGTEITDTFTQFTVSISGTGSVIDLKIIFDLDDGDTDIAIDNVKITGIDDSSLPITLSSFTATTLNGSVEIAWTTESEVNNLGFNLYRSESKDANYEKIAGLIEGAGNSTTQNTYNYTDTEVVPGHTYYYQLEDVSNSGKTEKHDAISVVVEENIADAAVDFQLHSAYPNPCNPTTNIRFDVPKESLVTLRIFDLQGRLVKNLVSEIKSTGIYNVVWNGTDNSNNPVGNGVYLYQLISETGFSQTNKVILLK